MFRRLKSLQLNTSFQKLTVLLTLVATKPAESLRDQIEFLSAWAPE